MTKQPSIAATARVVVSVVIPTYGHRDFVAATLNSVFAQTFADHEVIVVNDGSPDGTAEVLRPYAEAGLIRYAEQANAGQAAARNRGLAMARGEFVAFLDDDDLWPPDKLQWQVNALRESPDVLVGGWATLVDANNVPLQDQGAPPGPFTTRDLADRCPFYSPGQTLIRHDALERVGGLDESLWGADDYDLYIRLSKLAPLRISRRTALRYRVHGSNASLSRRRMFRNVLAVVRKHYLAGDAEARRAAFRWLYHYAGRDRVLSLKRCVKACDAAGVARATADLSVLIWPALTDRSLVREIARDLLPTRGLNAMRRHRLRVT